MNLSLLYPVDIVIIEYTLQKFTKENTIFSPAGALLRYLTLFNNVNIIIIIGTLISIENSNTKLAKSANCEVTIPFCSSNLIWNGEFE